MDRADGGGDPLLPWAGARLGHVSAHREPRQPMGSGSRGSPGLVLSRQLDRLFGDGLVVLELKP